MPYTTESKKDEYGTLCRKCENPKPNVFYMMWESDDGGHEDVKYNCKDCGHSWWVEGSDS